MSTYTLRVYNDFPENDPRSKNVKVKICTEPPTKKIIEPSDHFEFEKVLTSTTVLFWAKDIGQPNKRPSSFKVFMDSNNSADSFDFTLKKIKNGKQWELSNLEIPVSALTATNRATNTDDPDPNINVSVGDDNQ